MPSSVILPYGFTDLETVRLERTSRIQPKEYNIIGLVTDTLSPIVNQRNELQMTFRITDQRIFNAQNAHKNLKVRFFISPHRSDSLPKDLKMGDVILLRQTGATFFRNEAIIRPTSHTQWVVFPSASIPKPFFAVGFAAKQRIGCDASSPTAKNNVNESEQLFVIQLKADMEGLIAQNKDVFPFYTLGGLTDDVSSTKRPAVDTLESQKKFTKLGGFGPKLKLIEQVGDQTYADICGEVVKTFTARSGDVELYVTDYTTNPQLYSYEMPRRDGADGFDEAQDNYGRDGDDFGYSHSFTKTPKAFPGPYGKRVLKVILKDPHAEEAKRTTREGSYVLLQNVKITFVPGTRVLQGDLWPEWDNPTRLKLRLLKDLTTPEIIAIRERKADYLEKHAQPKDLKSNTRKSKDIKRKTANAEDRILPILPSMSSTEQEVVRSWNCVLSGERLVSTSKLRRMKAKLEPIVCRYMSEIQCPPPKPGNNTRCSDGEVPLTSLAEILDMSGRRHINDRNKSTPFNIPFINARYRTRVTVSDFYPLELHDFAVQHDVQLEDKSEFSQDATWDMTPKWEWAFSLLLKDASRRDFGHNQSIWVHISHLDAQFLLGNDMPDPADLRQNPQLLAKLREKLFCLWGNLEEIKSSQSVQSLSNVPFECCIREYGQPADGRDEIGGAHLGFIRLYQLFGTTIL